MAQTSAPGQPGQPSQTHVGQSPASWMEVVILALFMASLATLGLYTLWRFWPAPAPANGRIPPTAGFSYFGWHLSLTRDQQFFLVAALAGAIGATLHTIRSVSIYIGERYLFRSWIPYYMLLPIAGALLATVVYVALRAGLLTGSANSSQPDPYGVAAIAGLVGLFSAQAAEKLKAVFETLFTKVKPGSQSVATAPKPSITGFAPEQGRPGTPVVITGSNLGSVTGAAFANAEAAIPKIDSDARLTVVVPEGAATGPITLRAGQKQAVSDKSFTVLPAQARASRFRWPRRGGQP